MPKKNVQSQKNRNTQRKSILINTLNEVIKDLVASAHKHISKGAHEILQSLIDECFGCFDD